MVKYTWFTIGGIDLITFSRCDCNDKNFTQLTKCLDADLSSRNGKIQNLYTQYNRITDISTALVAFDDNIPVGCGCFKNYEKKTIEIKRIYVKPECRGKGIAKKMVNLLETWAVELGNTKAILETGLQQPEAIHLYEKIGYIKTVNYGQYVGVDNSVCFSKELK